MRLVGRRRSGPRNSCERTGRRAGDPDRVGEGTNKEEVRDEIQTASEEGSAEEAREEEGHEEERRQAQGRAQEAREATGGPQGVREASPRAPAEARRSQGGQGEGEE